MFIMKSASNGDLPEAQTGKKRLQRGIYGETEE
jgi:hypothetical protein